MDTSTVEAKANTLIVDGVGTEYGHFKNLYTAAAAATSGDRIKVTVSGAEDTAGFIKSGVSAEFNSDDGSGVYNLNAGVFLYGKMNIVNQSLTIATQFGGDGAITVGQDGKLFWNAAGAAVSELNVNGLLKVNENLAVEALRLTGGTAEISAGKTLSINHLTVSGSAAIIGTPDFHGRLPSVHVEAGASLTVDSAAASVLASGKILLLEGDLKVNGDLAWNTAGGLFRRNDGSRIFISGTLSGLDKLVIDNGKTLNINAGRIVGASGTNSITVGSESTGNFSAVEFHGGKNTVTLKSNATFTAEKLVNVSAIKLSDGKTYTDWNGKKVQGWTYYRSSGNVTGTSSYGLGFSIGKFAFALISGNCNMVNAAKSSLKIGSGGTAVISGTLSNLKKITIGNAASYKDENGKKAEMASSLEVGGDVATAVTGASVSVGKSAIFKVDGYFTMFGTGNKLALGANSQTEIGGKALNINTLNVSAGTTFVDSDNKKVQGFTRFVVTGDVSTNGSLNFSAGKYSATQFQSDVNAYKLTMKISTTASIAVGGRVFGLSNLNIASGSSAVTTQATFGGNIGGTTSADTISAGNNTSLIIAGNLDLEAGANRLSIGNDSSFRLNGLLANMKTVKTGKNCQLELSTQAVQELMNMGKNFTLGAGSTMTDIGDRAVAGGFTSAAAEREDDTLTSSSIKFDGSSGWLSNKDAYGKVNTYEDLIDFFTLGGSFNLTGWEIDGVEGSLKVTVYRHNGMAWDAGTLIEESDPGSWNLSGIDLHGSTDYRVSVAIAANADRNVYGYTVNQLA